MLHLREYLISKGHMNDDIFSNPFSPELQHFAGLVAELHSLATLPQIVQPLKLPSRSAALFYL